MEGEVTKSNTLSRESVSLYIAIGIMACVAIASVMITFTMFITSSAYTTVKDIQTNAKISGTGLADYDTTSPVKTADIDETAKAIESKIDNLDNQSDFSADAVSDTSLGFQR